VERKGIITFKGKAMTLIGPELREGSTAPDFAAQDRTGKTVRLDDFRGKIKVISVTPSLDTPVCDVQARRFNSEAAHMPSDTVVLNVSMDLPFAIDRFCTAAGIDKVTALSDHRDASFGSAYGVLIKELRLLARSIFIVDGEDRIRYAEIVPEQTNHPDYERALSALKTVTGISKAA